MGYKRRARVVFLGGVHPAPANLATHYAHKFGAVWMEAQAAVLPGVAGEVAVLDNTMLDWADLVVTLDSMAQVNLPRLPSGVQHRHYPFEPIPPAADKAAWGELAARVRQRVEGMIAGMRLLEKAALTTHADDL